MLQPRGWQGGCGGLGIANPACSLSKQEGSSGTPELQPPGSHAAPIRRRGAVPLLCPIPTASIFIFLTSNSCFVPLTSIPSTHPQDGIRILTLRSPLMGELTAAGGGSTAALNPQGPTEEDKASLELSR